MRRPCGRLIFRERSVGRLARFARETDGAAMVEALLVAPVILIFLAGVLEFGGMLVNKIEIETGLRDAARYLARCQDSAYGCNTTTARNLAVYGIPVLSDPPPSPRVPGWEIADILIYSPDSPEPIFVPNTLTCGEGGDEPCYRGGANIYVVRVETDIDYPGGTLLGLIGMASISMTAFHEERYIGW